MKATFKVREDLGWWKGDGFDEPLAPHVEHEASGEEQVRMVAAAEAAGSLIDVSYDSGAETLKNKHVESQEKSEAALAKAMEEYDDGGHVTGPWAEGNAILADMPDGEIEIGSDS